MFSFQSGTRSLLIFLFFAAGLWGYLRIPVVWVVPEHPEDNPALLVMLSWNRSDPGLMEPKTVGLLERGISLCEGVGRIYSVTNPDGAFVYITPKDPEEIEPLFVQIQMQLRRLSSYLPKGVSVPVLHHTGQNRDAQRFLSFILYGFETTPTFFSELLRRNNLDEKVMVRLSGNTFRKELQVFYDPVYLQHLDITPDELFQQITTSLKESTPPDRVFVLGNTGGIFPLGELATILPTVVPVYPIVRMNNESAWQLDFSSGEKINYWWLSYKLADELDDFRKIATTPIFTEKVFLFADFCLLKSRNAFVFFSLLLVLLLLSAVWWLRCWKQALFLAASFWGQLGLLLLLLSAVEIPITLPILEHLLLGEILFLMPLWLSLVRPSQGTTNTNYFFVGASLGLSVLDVLQFDPPGFIASPPALAMLVQVLSFGVVLLFFLPLYTTGHACFAQSSRIDLPRPSLWILGAFFLSFVPLSSESGEYQHLLKRYQDYLTDKQIDSRNKIQSHFQIELEAFPGVSTHIFESRVDKLGKQLQPMGTVITSLVDPGKALILLPWKRPFNYHSYQQILMQLQDQASAWADISISWAFDGVDFSQKRGFKKINYMLQITGYNHITTNNWTDTLINYLSLHPRIQEVSRVNSTGVEQRLTLPVALRDEGVRVRDLDRRLAFFEVRSWFDPRLQLRLLPKKQPVFIGSAQLPEWQWTEGDWWKGLPARTNHPIVRLNQAYLNKIQFDFLGTIQAGEVVLQQTLKQIRQKLPPGYQVSIAEGESLVQSGYHLDNWIKLVLVIVGVWVALFGISRLWPYLLWFFGAILPAFWLFSVGFDLPFTSEGTFVQGWLWVWILLPGLWLQFSGASHVGYIVLVVVAYIGAALGGLLVLRLWFDATPSYWMVWVLHASLSITFWLGLISWIVLKRREI